MAAYTVHEPPLKRYEAETDPERFVFVRDGFSFWAFLFGPLWMLRHRMWLVLLGYVAVVVAIELALHVLDVPAPVSVAVGLLLGLLIGVEAPTLRRFTLARRKWTNVGVIVGDDVESAERRFFDAWTRSEPTRSSPMVLAPRAAAASSDVVELFPEPGAGAQR
ncbi:MAG: hypothetical protein QOI12_1132 [Alphaproteobacteria bacterium]|jgi:hypothetical protein|nr:hypothetical protein [Alphaproteobacteria bacterium]